MILPDENTILGLGDDQLASQFVAIFPEGVPGTPSLNPYELGFYIDDSGIDPPEKSIGTYERWIRGINVPKLGGSEATTKELELTLHINQNWLNYDAIENWYNRVRSKKGVPGVDSGNRVPMEVWMLGRSDGSPDFADLVPIKRLVWENVQITSLKISEVVPNSEDPSKVTCGFIFSAFNTKGLIG